MGRGLAWVLLSRSLPLILGAYGQGAYCGQPRTPAPWARRILYREARKSVKTLGRMAGLRRSVAIQAGVGVTRAAAIALGARLR